MQGSVLVAVFSRNVSKTGNPESSYRHNKKIAKSPAIRRPRPTSAACHRGGAGCSGSGRATSPAPVSRSATAHISTSTSTSRALIATFGRGGGGGGIRLRMAPVRRMAQDRRGRRTGELRSSCRGRRGRASPHPPRLRRLRR